VVAIVEDAVDAGGRDPLESQAFERCQGCGISVRPPQESFGRMPQTADGLSCMFPEDSLFQDCRFDYTACPRREVAKTVIWDAG
jgi:hypothetical protein